MFSRFRYKLLGTWWLTLDLWNSGKFVDIIDFADAHYFAPTLFRIRILTNQLFHSGRLLLFFLKFET